MTQPQSPNVASGGGFAPAALFPPVVSYALGSSLAVATAAWLGADWLREPVAGLPAGGWVIAACAALGWVNSRGGLRGAGGSLRGALRSGRGDATEAGEVREGGAGVRRAGDGSAWGAVRAVWLGVVAPRVARVWEGVRFVASIGVDGEGQIGRVERWLCERHDRAAFWPASPLRVGVEIPESLAAALVQAGADEGAGGEIEWVPLGEGVDDADALGRMRLDAVVRRRGHGPVRVSVAEREGREAAWYDWACPPPLTLASLFPARIDPARVTLGWVDESDPDEAALLRGLIGCAAALSRSPQRLTLGDRIAGRRPMLAERPMDALRASGRPGAEMAARMLDRMAAMLSERERSAAEATPVQRAAAWVCSAWLSTPRPWMDSGARLRGIEAACATLGDEPGALLRLAAARYAAFEDEAGAEAVRAADRAIRASGMEPVVDHLAFVQSEVDLGLPAPATLGRVAAGICLVCATHPADRLSYLRDDLTDDMRYAGWLIGRDQDRAALMEVFRVLERSRGEARVAMAAAA